MRSRAPIAVTFRIAGSRLQTATGPEAQTIIALIKAGPKGITSLETFQAGWAVRLGAYVFDLKKMGVPIVTTREAHDGGKYGRYTLSGPVELVLVGGWEAVRRAVAP